MCSWRPSESLLICPCLLSPWPPDSHYSVVHACVCVCGSMIALRGVSHKDVQRCEPFRLKYTHKRTRASHFCPQQPWLPRPWKRRDWIDKSIKLLPFPPFQRNPGSHHTFTQLSSPKKSPPHKYTHTLNILSCLLSSFVPQWSIYCKPIEKYRN